MKIAIIGHGRVGKDESALRLRKHGLIYEGSVSWHMKEHVASVLDLPVQYAWENRSEFRNEWRSIIDKYREGDPARIIREMWEIQDVFSGIRPREEFEAAKKEGLIDYVAFIERPRRKDDQTFELHPLDADFKIENNGTIQELWELVDRMMNQIKNEFPE